MSQRFEVVLTPGAAGRRWVLIAGCIAAATGTLIVLIMPLSWMLRIPLALLWLLECLREMRALKRGAARLCQLRLTADGDVKAIRGDGVVEPLTLLSGSRVLGNLAWLRVRFADGLKYGELFLGDATRDPEWHRLQLMWRQCRGRLGRQDGS